MKRIALLIGIVIGLAAVVVVALNLRSGWQLRQFQENYLSGLGAPSDRSPYVSGAKTSDRVVAFTFDDGPHENTPHIASLLRQQNVPATFFLVCKGIDARKAELYRQFEVGMHGHDHTDFKEYEPQEAEDDVVKCLYRFSRSGLETTYFRPPYGSTTDDLTRTLAKYRLLGVLWNVDSRDWMGYEGQRLVDQVVGGLRPGGIVMFHDPVSVHDLETVINEVRRLDYQIIPLRDLLAHR